MQSDLSHAKCGAKTRSGKPCINPPVTGRNRCRMHGGKTPQGIATKNFKQGRYSKYIPAKLLERYEASVDDPELLNLRSEISLIESRMTDLLTRVDTKEAGKLWTEMRKLNDDLRRDFDNENLGAVNLGMIKIDRLIGSGLTDYVAWNEITNLIDQRRKLVEAESKRLIAMQQVVTSEQALTLVAALLSAVRDNIQDRQVLQSVQSRFNEIINNDRALK